MISNIFRLYPILAIIVLLNVCFYLMLHLPLLPNQLIYEKTAGANLLIANGEWWRLITPIFIHHGFSHLLFNSFAFVFIGIYTGLYEKPITLMAFYILAGIVGNVFSYIFGSITLIHIGSSGAVFGLLGFALFLIIFKRLPSYKIQALTVFIIFAVIFTFLQPGINEWAHIGGFVCGMAGGGVLYVMDRL